MLEETKSQLKRSVVEIDEPPHIECNWSMFEKICKLGEGGNGIVYKVKALCTTIFSSTHDRRIKLDNAELLKKYGSKKQQFGVNMQSSVENTNKTRQLTEDQAYVIKEIDVSVLSQQAAFDAMQEI